MVTLPVFGGGIYTYFSSDAGLWKLVTKNIQQQTDLGYHMVDAIYKQMTEQAKTDHTILKNEFSNSGTASLDDLDKMSLLITDQETNIASTTSIPTMKIGGGKIYGNDKIVNKVKTMISCNSAILQLAPEGLVRISTTVTTSDGKNAAGTSIPNTSLVYAAISKGENFSGRTNVLGINKWVETTPIKDPSGKTIGALMNCINETAYREEIKKFLSDLKIGTSGYFYILDKDGNYILSKEKKEDGKNVKDKKDSTGQNIIQKVIETAIGKKDGEISVLSYSGKDTSEDTRNKAIITTTTTYSPWGWVMGANIYRNDYNGGIMQIALTTVFCSIGAVSMAFFVSYKFGKSIAKKLSKLGNSMQKVAEGDLTIKIDSDVEKNEIGKITLAFGSMINSLRGMVFGITESTNILTDTAKQLSSSASDVNEATQRVSSGVKESTGFSQNLAKQTTAVSGGAKDLAQQAGKGSEAAQQAGFKMQALADAVNKSSENVTALGEKSKQIVQIVETISNIASQTNLLALNAAIEAARAGEAGRGFAVVADEVRKLAEESQTATENIGGLITEISSRTSESVKSMAVGQNAVMEGGQVVAEALESLETIVIKIGTITSSIETVSALAEQSSASAQQMGAGVQQTSASMQQVVSIAEKLTATSEQLEKLVSQFKLDHEIEDKEDRNY
ncbi:MAG: hypothetical protein UT66_C0001G0044 [candidate division CPR2 bacterium GW2011_GWC1_39_9]|uniref:Methyl-accepting chemotaxis protein n=1 Tax=candidate division CPR2 bacterium GW2011_GWC2_39_10 TaxID=1618345 RepID=A0A0G0LU27_UNCC2|nr:MAG: hypothetical protein UT18_C0001G0045 [candidate division CPR2 bacterium GW2011_GWC2_39_10]KKR36220.1 MAG: hypothetical protein UT66_C0001G0044 [candidate division CPR2 bacterium GW2011_GWC1_39_9]